MEKPYFDNILNELSVSDDNYVDSREYASHWNNKWVIYCDLIGFASMCLNSNDTTVNAIVRFHRCVSKVQKNIDNCKVYQFTDAAFCVTESPLTAIQFALQLANYSLAFNAKTIETKQNVLFNHLMVPRITIASGQILNLDNIEEPELLNGVDKKSFLAGSAIVKAYRLENKTYANAIAISGDDFNKILTKVNVRGDNDVIRNTMKKWFESRLKDMNDHVPELIELPWTFWAFFNENGDCWVENKVSFLKKMKILSKISDKMTGDFYTSNAGINLGKHQVGLQRYIFTLLCLVNNQKKFDSNKYKNPEEFIELL